MTTTTMRPRPLVPARRILSLTLLLFLVLLLSTPIRTANADDDDDEEASGKEEGEQHAPLDSLMDETRGNEPFSEEEIKDFGARGEEAGLDEESMKRMMEQMGGGGREFYRDIEPAREDVPLIQCQTCELLVKKLHRRAADRREKYKRTKLSENDVVDMMRNICNPVEEEGEWITEYDIVEEPEDGERVERLTLKRQAAMGQCLKECKTVALACETALGECESELAEMVYLNKRPEKEIIEKICGEVISDLKGSCNKPYPKVPDDRELGGDNFKVKSASDIAMDKVNREMRAMQDKLGARAFEL